MTDKKRRQGVKTEDLDEKEIAEIRRVLPDFPDFKNPDADDWGPVDLNDEIPL